MIKEHVARARQANTHPAKLMVLSSLLEGLFGVTLEELIPGIEKKLGSKIFGIRGSADLLFRNVIFEVKVNLEAELEDAKRKLKEKYFQALYEYESERRHIGIATDAIRFKAYLPVLKDDKVIDIREISSIDISTAPPIESILWLDSFIFSKPKIRPTADDLRWRFGPRSPTYSVAIDELTRVWDKVKDEPSVKLKLELWTKNMEIVYGSEPEVRVFLEQTYLVTLVKLIVYLRLSGDNVVRPEQIRRALTGEYFSSYGILNLIEEDFFLWLLQERIAEEALNLCCEIARELLRYDMSQIDEDLFKEIYQEIVERGQKHRIGEYYTPEWLVELTLKEAIGFYMEQNKKIPRILDPACGSGTFLTNSIYLLRNLLERNHKEADELLDIILNHVIGLDLNPLAVIIARANYLIALGELARLGKRVTIPVYVADSISLPNVRQAYAMTSGAPVDVYEFTVNKFRLKVPMNSAKQRTGLGEVLSGIREAIGVYRLRKNRDEAHGVFRRRVSELLNAAELEILDNTLDSILSLVDKGLNDIWVFMLNNIYAPIMLTESKFDVLASNPPWIAMRYVENKSYQDFLKENVLRYELLGSGETHLFTHMEMATLFFCRTADLFLRDGGLIAFVMPRSILTGAFQHARFRHFSKPQMKLLKIFDLEDVSPLFNVPACVLICKNGQATSYPVLARRFNGRLERKNERLETAVKNLSISEYTYEPPKIPTGYSYYHDLVKQGATIVPRNLWFIDFKDHPILGIDVSRPFVKTSDETAKNAKEPWRNIRLEGNVESDFIYVTILGGDLVPFGYSALRPIVLPVKPSRKGYLLLDVSELRTNGFNYMA
ncbi:MAG: N-6 DNA methylase, partial [Nitrososphaerota archaeon]